MAVWQGGQTGMPTFFMGRCFAAAEPMEKEESVWQRFSLGFWETALQGGSRLWAQPGAKEENGRPGFSQRLFSLRLGELLVSRTRMDTNTRMPPQGSMHAISRYGCREGRRPFVGFRGKAPDGMQGQSPCQESRGQRPLAGWRGSTPSGVQGRSPWSCAARNIPLQREAWNRRFRLSAPRPYASTCLRMWRRAFFSRRETWA